MISVQLNRTERRKPFYLPAVLVSNLPRLSQKRRRPRKWPRRTPIENSIIDLK